MGFLGEQKIANILELLVANVMQCVRIVHYIVMINGSDIEPIYPSRCLRYGDPSLPYPFYFCMIGLSTFINDKDRQNILQGLRFAEEPHLSAISHLLFTDDADI